MLLPLLLYQQNANNVDPTNVTNVMLPIVEWETAIFAPWGMKYLVYGWCCQNVAPTSNFHMENMVGIMVALISSKRVVTSLTPQLCLQFLLLSYVMFPCIWNSIGR